MSLVVNRWLVRLDLFVSVTGPKIIVVVLVIKVYVLKVCSAQVYRGEGMFVPAVPQCLHQNSVNYVRIVAVVQRGYFVLTIHYMSVNRLGKSSLTVLDHAIVVVRKVIGALSFNPVEMLVKKYRL